MAKEFISRAEANEVCKTLNITRDRVTTYEVKIIRQNPERAYGIARYINGLLYDYVS